MGINKCKWFLNISCVLFLICFATLSSSPLTYAQVGITPESFYSSPSSFPTLGAPSYNFSSFGATSFNAPAYGATSFSMPGYGAPSFGATGFGMPNFGGSFGAPSFGATGFGMPSYGGGFGAPSFGATGFGMPTYGAPSSGASAYGATGFGMPGFGTPSFGAPSFGATGFGMPGFGTPTGFGAPFGGFGSGAPMGFGAPIGGFGFPGGYGGYNPYGYPPSSGGSRSSQSHSEPEYESGFYTENELPNIKGNWSGRWEAFKTDKDGVVTDPNGQIIIEQEGELSIYIKSQKSSGGKVSGTIELIGWNVDEHKNWEGETEEIEITGWLDGSNGWLNAHYFYFTGTELKSDYSNLISDFLWNFHNLEVNASESGIFGQFRVRGSIKTSKGNKDYELIGKFQVGKYLPED